MIVNERCSAAGNLPKNTGRKTQCLDKQFYTFFKVRNGFSFPSVEASKTEAAWTAALIAKDIIPTYIMDSIDDNETAKVEYEGGNETVLIKEAIKGSTYGFRLSTCSHEALKSLESVGYKNIIRVTSDNYFRCITNEDGSISPEVVSYFSVGTQKEATFSEPSKTEVSIKYGTYSPSDYLADFDLANMEGILDLDFNIVSATSTEITFTATDSCAGSNVTDLVLANLAVLDMDGVASTVSLTGADANGVYTVTGTGFANGYTVGTAGVIEKEGDLYEGQATVSV